MKTILVVAPFFPLPSNYGGKKDVWNRIVALSNLGYIIDLIYTDSDDYSNTELDLILKTKVRNSFFVKRTDGFFYLLSKDPYQVTTRANLKNFKFIDVEYDITILESESVGNILKNTSLQSKKFVLRVHNNESKYFYSLAKSAIPKPSFIYYLLDGIRYKYYSSYIFERIDNFLFISKDEMESSIYLTHKNYIALLPDFELSETVSYQKKSCPVAIFIGSLFMQNNREAVDWYLQKVHQQIISEIPDYKFIVVGSTKGKNLEAEISTWRNIKSVEVYTDVPDVNKYYNDAMVFVNPMINGAGVKVKSVECIIKGVPLVSTRVGIEGIGLTNSLEVLIAKDERDFVEMTLRTLKDVGLRETLVTNAQAFLKNTSHENLLPPFLENLL